MVNVMTNGPIPPSPSRLQIKRHYATGHFALVYLDEEEPLAGDSNDGENEACIMIDPALRRLEEILCRAQQNQQLKRIRSRSTGPDALVTTTSFTTESSAPQHVSLPEFTKFDSFVSEVLLRTAGANGQRRQEVVMGGEGRTSTMWPGEGGTPSPKRRLGKLHHLIALVEEQVGSTQERRKLRQLLLDAQPRHSKWYDPNRPGQAELYDELERVLVQLKAFTPHSGPFLQRVNRKEVPDYYEVIKKPMDLNTMMKKLRAHAYHDRKSFQADLDLIYSNCYLYNAEESPFRRHVDLLRERWTVLMRSVPDIVVETTAASGTSTKDELDLLLTTHLDRFSDEESSGASVRSVSQGSTISVLVPSATDSNKRTASGAATSNAVAGSSQGMKSLLCLPYPVRSGAGMSQFLEEGGCNNIETDALFFHQALPEPGTVDGPVGETTLVEMPVPKIIKNVAHRFCQLRGLLRGTIKHNNGMHQSFPDLGKFVLPDLVKSIPGNLMTPRRGRYSLAQSIAWLGMQAGFEAVQRPALDCLTDIVSYFVGAICTSLKLYIEELASTGGAPAANLSQLGANYLIQEYEPRGIRPLLRLVRDAPEQLERRLERAIWLVRERLQFLTTIGTGEYGSTGIEDEGGITAAGEETNVATDIDLDLLGGDDSTPGLETNLTSAANTQEWSPSGKGDLSRGNPHHKIIINNNAGDDEADLNDGDEEDDEEDPSGGDHEQSTLRELLDAPLEFAAPLDEHHRDSYRR